MRSARRVLVTSVPSFHVRAVAVLGAPPRSFNEKERYMIRGRASALAVVLAGIVVSFGLSASAGLITLTDDTSTMELDPSSSAGVFSWRIGEIRIL